MSRQALLRRLATYLLCAAAASCGQEQGVGANADPDSGDSHVADSGPDNDSDIDVSADSPADAIPDSISEVDSDGGDDSSTDAPSDVDLDGSAVACEALAPLTEGVILADHAWQVLFTSSRQSLVFRASGNVLRFDLLTRELFEITKGVYGIEWLNPDSDLLVKLPGTGTIYGLGTVPLQGGPVRQLADSVCFHIAAPDGKRIYVLRNCTDKTGTLEVVNVDSGEAQPLASDVSSTKLAVSPDSQWAAYVAVDETLGERVVHVVDADGSSYPITSHPGATAPGFVPDGTLVFQVPIPLVCEPPWLCGVQSADFYAHVPGQGDSATMIAHARVQVLRDKYLARDGLLLIAEADPTPVGEFGYGPYKLFGARLVGSGEILLASNLYPFWHSHGYVKSVTFSFDGSRIIYYTYDPAISPPSGLSSVLTDGTDVRVLATHLSNVYFAVSPTSDDLAFAEPVGEYNERERLRIVSSTTGLELNAFESEDYGLGAIFVPDGRGVLFYEWNADESLMQLRFLPRQSGGGAPVLGKWDDNHLDGDYAVDPTGCFVVYDDRYGPSPGTHLALVP